MLEYLEKIRKTGMWRLLGGISGIFFTNAIKSYIDDFAKRNSIAAWGIYVALFCVSLILFEALSRGWNLLLRYFKRAYTAEEKSGEAYCNLVTEQIGGSQSISFLLLSAYTMFYDTREQFIIKALQRLSPEERQQKQIRVLMLHPLSKNFQRRAAYFVDQMKKTLDPARVDTVEEYTRRCMQNADELKGLGAQVRYYSFDPIWRLQIFDDCALFSFYSRQKSGHMTSSYLFPKQDANSAYFGFSRFYEWMWNGSVDDLEKWPRLMTCPHCSKSFPHALPPLHE